MQTTRINDKQKLNIFFILLPPFLYNHSIVNNLFTVKYKVNILLYHTVERWSYMNYTKRLYDLRIDNDYRQEDVANFLNITKQAYGMYENGKRNLPIEYLVKLSEFYCVSTDFILNLTNNPQKPKDIEN